MAGIGACMSAAEPTAGAATKGDAAETAALARGGRASFIGYVLRLAARFPFLFIAGRLYGAEALGRFAYATMVVELVAMLATLGLKRGLAEDMAARGPAGEGHALFDSLLASVAAALLGAGLLILFPGLVFPLSDESQLARFFPFVIVALAVSDVSLAALAFRHDIAATVRARSLIEPWTLSLVALALAFTAWTHDGLIIAYVLSLVAAAIASIWPALRRFGTPRGWQPDAGHIFGLVRRNLPLAGADIAEWGARRLDIFILGRFASAEVVGIYYVAQQVASLPQRLKSSFDPILAPVLAVNLARGDFAKMAAHIRQIGFWIGAAQIGVVISLAFTGKAGMGLFGPVFAFGLPVLVMLLVSELLAAQAAVAEAALVYVARGANLAWSIAGLVVQAGLSLFLVPRFGGLGAAGALAASALLLSIAKSLFLARRLGHPVAGWRWVMALAAIPAGITGWLVTISPEWFQVTVGWLIVVAVYGGVIWRFGFKGADRLLFARGLRQQALAAEDGAPG